MISSSGSDGQWRFRRARLAVSDDPQRALGSLATVSATRTRGETLTSGANASRVSAPAASGARPERSRAISGRCRARRAREREDPDGLKSAGDRTAKDSTVVPGGRLALDSPRSMGRDGNRRREHRSEVVGCGPGRGRSRSRDAPRAERNYVRAIRSCGQEQGICASRDAHPPGADRTTGRGPSAREDRRSVRLAAEQIAVSGGDREPRPLRPGAPRCARRLRASG